MMRVRALAIVRSGIAAAATAIWLVGCVVTPEPIPLFDGTPWSPSPDMDKGGRDAQTAFDSGYGLDGPFWVPPDASMLDASMPDAFTLDGLAPDALSDGRPDGLEDSAPPGEGGAPFEGGPTSDTVSPTYDGLTGDVVLQE